MACVNVTDVQSDNAEGDLSIPFTFQITFECTEELKEDIQWKLTYVGCPEKKEYDQELEDVMLGPLQVGVMKFSLTTPPPDYTKVPQNDLVGVTCILITGIYRDKEFIRIGYYVNIEYNNQEMQLTPPEIPDYTKLIRRIVTDSPRVTKFVINWDEPNKELEIDEKECIKIDEEEKDGEEKEKEEEEDEEEEDEEEDDEEDDEEEEEGKNGEEEEEDIEEEEEDDEDEEITDSIDVNKCEMLVEGEIQTTTA
eukprot:GHVL01000802.1.p1 GENE.GHVL01000802.1~~GHVL01000802.1.p1  ORF type:complete len:252 (+),score=102.58 GHVL01000802.1:50-805(+)